MTWDSPPVAPISPPLRLGILASGSGSNMEAIAMSIQAGRLPAHIQIVVYNNPEAYVVQRAESWDIPALLCNHRDYSSREAFDRAIVALLQQYEVELVVMAGWMRIVTQELIDAFPDRILNIHPSLLPSFPGHRAVEQALQYGVKISGCTVHVVTLAVDSGPILAQAAVPVLPTDTVTSLHQRIQNEEHRIFSETIASYGQQLRPT